MENQDPRLREIWAQTVIPVVFRQMRPKPLLVRLPFASGNKIWLQGVHRGIPKWNPHYKCWETPNSWFDELIERCLRRFRKVYAIQLYREKQICAPACWNAKRFHCECSCMGAHHGAGHPGGSWYEVSETFACGWGPRQYACRLIAAKDSGQMA